MEILALIALFLPIVGAIIVLVGAIPKVLRGERTNYFALTFAGLTAIASLILIIYAYAKYFAKGLTIPSFTFGQMPWIGLKVGLFGALIDPLSILMLSIVSIIGFFIVLYSTEYMSPRNKEHPITTGRGRYYGWLLLFIGSMIGIALAPNLIQFLIFWELTTICSAALIAFYEKEEDVIAGFKALIMTHAPGLFFFVALALLFIYSKSFEFAAIGTLPTDIKITVVVFFLIAAWAKSAQFPFFTWLPDAMVAPTPISGFLHAAAMVNAGVFLIARIVITGLKIPFSVGIIISGFALLTMYIGFFFYFFQDDLKKLLAYSTITHLAYIFVGLGLGAMGSKIGLEGGILHLINHAFSKVILFLAVGALAYATGTRLISKLSGVGRKMPIVGFCYIFGILAVTGIPPFPCFWSKFAILVGAIGLKSIVGYIIAGLILIETLGTFIWFLKIAQKVFFGEPSIKEEIKDPPLAMTVSLISLVILSLVAPFFGMALIYHLI